MRRKIVVLVLILIAIVAATVVAVRSRISAADPNRITASGTVEATEARLGFQTPGRIASIAVNEGERVAAGTVLATLDSSELSARRAQAVAKKQATDALLTELTSGSRTEEIGVSAATVDAAQEKLQDATRDRNRNRILYEGGAISAEALQKSETAVDVAAAQVDQAREQMNMVKRGPRVERITAQRAQVSEATAAIAGVDAALANSRIIAPHAGVVTVRHREPNEVVAPGQPVLTVMNPADRWVRIYVSETSIGAVHLGDRGTLKVDTYPDKSFAGQVVYISPEAEFTPKNVQTPEERVKLVYAVKVRIDDDPQVSLKPGMPVDVTLTVRR